jgi:hypothetical protein
MQNHLRVIQEQAESQAESRVDISEMIPQSPISGRKSSRHPLVLVRDQDQNSSLDNHILAFDDPENLSLQLGRLANNFHDSSIVNLSM